MGARPRPLQPSLWRTCRALANRRRLRILRHLDEHGGQSVSEIAADLRMPIALVSQYARILNARGLLAVRRRGAEVRYAANPDTSVAAACALMGPIREALRGSRNGVEEVYRLVTATTHPRRELILATLRDAPRTAAQLRMEIRIPARSLRRQIAKLLSRGLILKDGQVFQCVPTPSPIARVLISLSRTA